MWTYKKDRKQNDSTNNIMASIEGKMAENWLRLFGQVKRRSLKAHCMVLVI